MVVLRYYEAVILFAVPKLMMRRWYVSLFHSVREDPYFACVLMHVY